MCTIYFLNETSACVSVVSDVQERVRDLGSPLRFMLRRSSLVECVSVLHGTKKKSSPIYLAQKVWTLFDALDEREIAR
jgi:hypothetical protein